MDKERERKIVEALWNVMTDEGMCDGYGGAEYSRCEPIVVDFLRRIHEACNSGPTMGASIEIETDLVDVVDRAEERLRLAFHRLNPADRNADSLVDLVLAELDPDRKSPNDVHLLAYCTLMRLAWSLQGVERLPRLRPQNDHA